MKIIKSACLLVLIQIFILTECLSQNTGGRIIVHLSEYKLSFKIPYVWDSIPYSAIVESVDSASNLLGKSLLNYDGGLYYKENVNYFDNPYILYRFVSLNTSKMKEFSMDELSQSTIKHIMGITNSVDFKNNWKDLINYFKLIDLKIDYKRNGLFFSFDTELVNIGEVRATVGVYFGANGAFEIFCYSEKSNYDKFKYTFKTLFDSFKFDDDNILILRKSKAK